LSLLLSIKGKGWFKSIASKSWRSHPNDQVLIDNVKSSVYFEDGLDGILMAVIKSTQPELWL